MINKLNAQNGLKFASQRIQAEGAERPRAKAKIYRDVFQSLDRAGEIDPGFAKRLQELEAHSVSDKADLRLWSTGLEIASQLVPGPTGALLSENVASPTLRGASRLAKEYGKEALPLLETIVPTTWSEGGENLEGETGVAKWGLGQATNLIREGAEDTLDSLWLMAGKVGVKISADDVQRAKRNEEGFLSLYSDREDWKRADGESASNLDGHQVAGRVFGEDGKIETVSGLLFAEEPDRYGSARYTILQENGSLYEGNSNEDWLLFARTQDERLQSRRNGLEPPKVKPELSVFAREIEF